MINVWCVRAEFGTYTPQFLKGGYVAIGWMKDVNLASIASRDELYPIYRREHPTDTSNIVVGQQVGQIARFIIEMAPGDMVITPDADTELLWHGTVLDAPSYAYVADDPSCPYPHRRRVEWAKKPILRSGLSVPLQNTMRSSLTVFQVSPPEELLALVGREVAPPIRQTVYDPYEVVLKQILELDDKEFEILTANLLQALGFEGSEVTGKSGDGGVDARGELNVGNLAKVKVFVQAKRYKLGARISAGTVRQLRQAIPFGGQGAFITTADFQSAAFDVALEAGFPRIGLINGRQLVDLLVEHWSNMPKEFRDLLGLKPGLVKV